jgi:hypothetical protein
MNETDLRDALREHAESFKPDVGWLTRIPAPGRTWKRRAIAVSPLVAAAAAAATILAPVYLHPDGASQSEIRGHSPALVTQPIRIQLAGYAPPIHGAIPKPLEKHLTCMRTHGYDLPDPTWTGHGWSMFVQDPRQLGFGTQRWKRTAFVTCALTRRDGGRFHELPDVLMHPRPRLGR